MTIWFSSDHHFHHENIIRFCHRPFNTVQEMNDTLVDLHNKYVKSSDHWYCLGDVTMLRDNQGRGLGILRRMNGHKRLIMGNHDHYAMKHYLEHFEKVMAMNRLDDVWFTHVPVHPSSMGSAVANVHGHIHNNQPDSFKPVIYVDKKTQEVKIKPYVNISVEVTDYRPLSFEEVKQRIIDAGGSWK